MKYYAKDALSDRARGNLAEIVKLKKENYRLKSDKAELLECFETVLAEPYQTEAFWKETYALIARCKGEA